MSKVLLLGGSRDGEMVEVSDLKYQITIRVRKRQEMSAESFMRDSKPSPLDQPYYDEEYFVHKMINANRMIFYLGTIDEHVDPVAWLIKGYSKYRQICRVIEDKLGKKRYESLTEDTYGVCND